MGKEVEWFKSLGLEEMFYKAIEANHLLEGDTVDNHPSRLTEEQIKVIYDYNFDNSSIVRQNLLKDKEYRGYCGSELCKPRKFHPMRGERWPRTVFNFNQFECPKCRWKSEYPKTFIELYRKTHNITCKN